MAMIRLEIITAEEVVYSDEVEVLVAPGTEGGLGDFAPSRRPDDDAAAR